MAPGLKYAFSLIVPYTISFANFMVDKLDKLNKNRLCTKKDIKSQFCIFLLQNQLKLLCIVA